MDIQTTDIEHKRHMPNHSVITKFWKDLCITPYGEIVNEKNKHELDEYVLIDYYEPICWCCGKVINIKEEEERYQQILSSTDPFKVWDMVVVRSHLNRCHIIPFSQGGSDDPSNLFLMCESCHRESPDFINPKYFLKYVYERKKNSVFGMRKEELYNLFDYFKNLCNTYNKDLNDLLNIDISAKKHDVGSHGGNVSLYTIVSALCDLLPEKKSIFIKYNDQK